MKKKYLLRFAIVLLTLVFLPEPTFADVIQQKDTVTGLVIGKDKEPIPGAKVEIVDQPYSAFTDIDGRFNIKCEPGAKKVLVIYPKAKPIKKKISPDMTVQIGRTWRQAPENYQWFVGANIGIGWTVTDIYLPLIPPNGEYFDPYYDDGFVAPTISIMAGRVKTVGWYVKVFSTPSARGVDYDYYEIPNNHCHNMGAILGGMVRLGCPLHFYLGGGFSYTKFTEIPSSYYHRHGWQMDMGLLFRIKDHFGINTSLNLGTTTNNDYAFGSFLNLGVSYFFNK